MNSKWPVSTFQIIKMIFLITSRRDFVYCVELYGDSEVQNVLRMYFEGI